MAQAGSDGHVCSLSALIIDELGGQIALVSSVSLRGTRFMNGMSLISNDRSLR